MVSNLCKSLTKDVTALEGWLETFVDRENGGTLGMLPLTINPIYTLCRGYLLGISPFKGLLGWLTQLGYHPRVPAFSLWSVVMQGN